MASINRILLLQAMHTQGKDCALCGLPTFSAQAKERHRRLTCPTLDHIIPKSEGGRTHIENARVAHKYCNERRSSLLLTPDLINILRTDIKMIMAGRFIKSGKYREPRPDQPTVA